MVKPVRPALPPGIAADNEIELAEPGEAAEETAVDRLHELLVKGRDQDQARVKLSEIMDDGTVALCRDYTPEEFEAGGIDMVRKKWGPGRYRIELYAHNPTSGRFSRYGRANILLKPEREPDPADNVSGQLAAVLERIEKAIAPRDPMAGFKEMLGLAALMREAFGMGGGAPAATQPTVVQQMTELMSAARGFKQLTDELGGGDTPTDPLLALAPKAMDIVQAAIAGAKPPAPLPNVRLPPTLIAAPDQNPAAAGAAGTGSETATTIQSPPAAPGGVAAEGTEVKKPTNEFTHMVQTYVGLAVMGADTEKTADMIFETAPDELETLLKRADWFELLCQAEGTAASHRQWFTDVRQHLLTFFDEERKLPPEPAGDGLAAGVARMAPMPKGGAKKQKARV